MSYGVRCLTCERPLALPFRCRYCGGTFCIDHLLPESHSCEGLLKVKPIQMAVEEYWPPAMHEIRPAARPTALKLTFYPGEVMELLVAMAVVSMAFIPLGYFIHIPLLKRMLPYLLLGVAAAFVLHELAHKATATRYGSWARFCLDRFGLMLTLFSIILPIKIIAPGYVLIRGPYLDEEAYGKIAAAGPITNIVLCVAFWILELFCPPLNLAMRINATIAFFNSIPIGVLDGAKILRWNVRVWAMIFLASTGLWLFGLLHGP